MGTSLVQGQLLAFVSGQQPNGRGCGCECGGGGCNGRESSMDSTHSSISSPTVNISHEEYVELFQQKDT